MARAYTVATVAIALKVPAKWLDNALSHHTVDGVTHLEQGTGRRLGLSAVVMLSIALALMNDLGLSLPASLWVARSLSDAQGRLATASGLRLELDLDELRKNVVERLNHAVEIAPVPRRGRPPQNKTGRLA